MPVSTASDFSKLSAKRARSVPAAEAAHIESLEDLQPEDASKKGKESVEARTVMPKGTLGQSTRIRNVFGEFTFAGQSCRLFEYGSQSPSEALVLIACKKGAGDWKVIQ